MSNLLFESIMAQHFTEFIKLKRSLGYKYSTAEYLIREFDTFLVRKKITYPILTKEIFDEWMTRRKHESGSTYKGRCTVVMQFVQYMSDIGKPCYIPRMPNIKVNGFTAHIFTEEEIDRFFTACDNLILHSLKMNSAIIMLPAIFRLLYGTGIRVTEAIRLKNCDVNLEEKYIVLHDTKSSKDRLVPISDSVATVCREYKSYRERLPIIADKEYFFLALSGKPCASDGTIYFWFRTILKNAGIPHNGRHQGPRVHDLRHTFSVHSLMKMHHEGGDLYCSLPILSTYLGHSSIQSTNNYVRLCESMYPDLIQRIDIESMNVYPNLYKDETD